jgi:DNA-binding helix-hairpin-helix protein with protein kinase domain
MTGMLHSGVSLHTAAGAKVEYREYIGAGGEGEVYRVTVGGEPKALKWYYPQSATEERRKIVDELVNYPATDPRFLWPEALVLGDGVLGFGYIMRLRPDSFAGLPDLFLRRVSAQPRSLTTAGLLLVEAFQTLHRDGIAYRDISWGNVFFEPVAGEVLICDNDNAVFDGRRTEIAGTMEFMAPELVRGDAGARPSVQTDLHSLAVLLFMILVNHHPFEGKRALEIHCLDDKAKKLLYGTRPLFIFDPGDRSNRADEVEHKTAIALWRFIPGALRELFVKAFTAGLRDPGARVREGEWIDALGLCRDSIISCRRCFRQNMTEPGVGLASLGTCWNCRNRLESLGTLTLATAGNASRRIVLDRESRVYAHHLGEGVGRHDFGQVRAEVREHPQRPGRYGLTNLTDRLWSATARDGRHWEVLPGRSVTLSDGLTIIIGGFRAAVALG